MNLLSMGSRVKAVYCFNVLWLCLNLCLHFYLYGCLLYGCLCWKMHIIADRCLKCIFEHLDFTYDAVNVNCLFILCISMLWNYLLYPELLFFLLDISLIHTLSDVFRLFFSLYLILYSWIFIVIQKTTKTILKFWGA